MDIRINIQPFISTMQVQLKVNKRELGQSFLLSKEGFVDECLLDGRNYEINRQSTQKGKYREYNLPIGWEQLELRFEAPLLGKTFSAQVLTDLTGLWPGARDSHPQRNFYLSVPQEFRIVTNYEKTNERSEDGKRVQIFKGKDEVIFVIGRFHEHKRFNNQFYLLRDKELELFEKFMWKCTRKLIQDLDLDSRYSEMKYVEVEEIRRFSGLSNVLFVETPTWTDFEAMPEALLNFIRQAFVLNYHEDFAAFEEKLYQYLTWKGLEAVMSKEEMEQMLPERLHRGEALADKRQLGIEGVLFFKALNDQVGDKQFFHTLRKLREEHLHRPLSLVHFMNAFSEASDSKTLLENWLFGRDADETPAVF